VGGVPVRDYIWVQMCDIRCQGKFFPQAYRLLIMKTAKLIGLFFIGALCVFFLALDEQALAQTEQGSVEQSSAVPEALNPASINSLVSKLEPEQVDALSNFIDLLNTSVSPGTSDLVANKISVLTVLKESLAGFRQSTVSNILQLPDAIGTFADVFRKIFEHRDISGNLKFLALMLLAIAVGFVAERLFDMLVNAWREGIKNTATTTMAHTLKLLSARGILEVGGAFTFVIVAYIVTRIVYSDHLDQAVSSRFFLNVVLIYRVAAALLRFVLAPRRPDLRLVSTDDWTAQYVYRNTVILAVLAGIGLYIVSLMHFFDMDGLGPLRFWLGLIFHGWIIFTIWNARKGLTTIILGEEEFSSGLARMAAWWPPLAILTIAFNWILVQFISSAGDSAFSPGRSALAVTLIIVTPFLDTIVRSVAAHLVPAIEGGGAVAERAHHATELCYVRVGRVILLSFLIILIGKLWGISFTNLAEGGLGAQFAANITGFFLILALGYMAWEIINLVINKKLAREMEASGVTEGEEGNEGGGAGLTRMATVLPILRMTMQVTIIIITLLLALSQIGVNITPLLAGAGVLGLAIGFGAQTLVKDIVSGVFFLLDDAFRVGEYIDTGGTQGTVEKISVRSLQLRGTLGPVHIIPYGSMSQLTNMSRDWVTMKLKFTIPFDTDLEKVRKLFKKIGQEMMENPELADSFLAPFKGQGAADVTDTGIVVRGKFTTRPGDQWTIRKEVYNRVQKAFEENGIEFARREVRVQFSEADEEALTPEQKKAVSAAASQIVEQENAKKS